MIRAPGLLLALASFAGLLLGSEPARGEVDPRYQYSAELGVGGGVFGRFGSVGGTSVNPLIRLQFLAPWGENVQGGGGLAWVPDGPVTLQGGVRFISESEPWQTRLDVQGAVRVRGVFGVGARLAVGGTYQFAKGWRVGAEVGGTFLAVNVQASLEPSALVSWSF